MGKENSYNAWQKFFVSASTWARIVQHRDRLGRNYPMGAVDRALQKNV